MTPGDWFTVIMCVSSAAAIVGGLLHARLDVKRAKQRDAQWQRDRYQFCDEIKGPTYIRQPKEREQLICAAIRLDYTIIRCHRHSDGLNVALYQLTARGADTSALFDASRQGFLTSCNRFVTRAEAAEIHRANGGSFIGSIITSEDLW